MTSTHFLFESIFNNTHSEFSSLQHQMKELQTVYQSNEAVPIDESETDESDQEEESLAKFTEHTEPTLDESTLNKPLLSEFVLSNKQINKFKKIYSKNKIDNNVDDNDNVIQKIKTSLNKKDEEAQLIKLQTKFCCKDSCLQKISHEDALVTYQNFQSLSKSYRDMFMLGFLSATIRDETTTKGQKRLRLANIYMFEGIKICSNAFLIIYGIGKTY